MAVPKYMQKGSKGPHVSLLHAFLCGFGRGGGIVFDQEYGDMTTRGVSGFQFEHGLDNNGHFDPATRARAKHIYGFDFEAACESVPGVTEFVQPDKSVISWWPGDAAKLAVQPDVAGNRARALAATNVI